MSSTFIKAIHIKKVRHLENITIPLGEDQRRHLILTGKNGSGKTSVLEAVAEHLRYLVSRDFKPQGELEKQLSDTKKRIDSFEMTESGQLDFQKYEKYAQFLEKDLLNWTNGAIAECTSIAVLRDQIDRGEFILAYHNDKRLFQVNEPKYVARFDLNPIYRMDDHPGEDFLKYIVNLKVKQALAVSEKKPERAEAITAWFDRFEAVLRDLFEDDSLRLEFDMENFKFNIIMKDREPFDFNTMSMGYSAVFSIICDLMMRMESKLRYDLEGIVLIDEIETHLHVELQKKIVPTLIRLFPNIQFILTTHSPFILSSVPDSVVYDLEKKVLVEDGFTNLSYEGIVEGYFDTAAVSDELKEKLEEYRKLSEQPERTVMDRIRMKELELYLEEIPDFLSMDAATEYQRLKALSKR